MALGLLTLGTVVSVLASPEPLPEPGEADSHARYVEALREAERSLAAELLARYEQRLADAPDDAVAAVERCQFLGAAFYDPETDENPREEEREACVADLEQRFADDPAARVFAIEGKWGDEARDAGEAFLEEPPPSAQPEHLAAVHAHLARAFDWEDSAYAAAHAESAMALDRSLDLRLTLARGQRNSGDIESARASLREGLLETDDIWALEQKASLLVELGDFEVALSAFREAERRSGDPVDRSEYARALAGVGEIEAARAAWAKLAEGWLSNQNLRERFEFELAHGDGTTARNAYDALFARGRERDPFGRDLLTLLIAHPDAPWKLADAQPLVVLAIIGFCISLVPALWILPVAWAGLARNRFAVAADATPEFGLHQAWAVSSLYLLVQIFSALVYVDAIAAVGSADPAHIDPALFARYALLSAVTSLIAVLLLVRKRGVRLLRRGRWGWRRTALAGTLGWLASSAVSVLVRQVIGGGGGASSFSNEMIHSVNQQFGIGTGLFTAALLFPIAEELAFRGVLLSAFQRPLGTRWANVAQATLFGMVHWDPVVTPFSFAMGLIAGWMTQRSKTLRPALLMHVINNVVVCVALAARS